LATGSGEGEGRDGEGFANPTVGRQPASRHSAPSGGRWSSLLTRAPRDASIWFSIGVAISRLVVALLTTQAAASIFSRGPFAVTPHTWVSGFLSWDSLWYVGLANGYASPRDTVFLPGYPQIVHLASWASGEHLSLVATGLGVSWIAFIVSAPLLLVLLRELTDDATARLAVVLYAWSPASVFLLAAYPVSTFVLTSTAALILVQRQRLTLAAVVAGLSTGVVVFGVGLAVAIAAAAFQRRRRWAAIPLGILSCWGIGGYMIWLWVRFQDPLIFVRQQATFNRYTVLPFAGVMSALFQGRDPAGTPEGFPVSNFLVTRDLNLVFGLLSAALFVFYAVDVLRGRARIFALPFSLFAAVAFFVPSVSVQTFHGVSNPEAMTRHANANVGLHGAVALLLRRARWLAPPVLSMWIGFALVFQLVFTLGWYFT
jgi:hypothetical protein